MAALCNFSALAQTTTIWLVRHAEKSADNTTNPSLTELGTKRAEALAKVLADKSITAIYSTNYKRTLSTAAPLAAQLNLQPIIYSPNDIGSVAQTMLKDHKGKSALIVGHSNTIIPVIKALGAATPFDELNDSDYDLLFKVLLTEKGKLQLTIVHYGDSHHVTEIPVAYADDKL